MSTGIDNEDIVIARDKSTGEKYYAAGKLNENNNWTYAHASANDVLSYTAGLCKEDFIDAIANKTYEFSVGIAGSYEDGIRSWCDSNGLEIIGVLGK